MSLPEALAAEIDRRDLTQNEAAKEIGVSQQVLSRWINGQAQPKPDYIPDLAWFLGVSAKKIREMRGPTRRNEQRLDKLEAEVDELRKLLVAIAARVGVEP